MFIMVHYGTREDIMETKLAKLKQYMAAGNHRAALQLAASWGRRGLGGGAHAEAITKAWAALNYGDFYRETGQDPVALVAAGLAAIRERYNIGDVTDDNSPNDADTVQHHPRGLAGRVSATSGKQ